MRNLFFYTSVTAFLLGVAIGTCTDVADVYVWWLLTVGLVLGCIGVGRSQVSAATTVLLGGLTLVLVAAGMLRTSQFENKLQSQTFVMTDHEVVLEGVVIREPERREKTTHVYIEVQGQTILAYVDRYTPVAYGDRVEVVGQLQQPEAFTTDVGRTFDYAGYLAAKGVTKVIYYPVLTVQEAGLGNVFFEKIYKVKDAFRQQVQQSIVAPQSALGEGLLLGVNGVLGEQWEEIFRQVGIIHIVVLSGYNIMLVIIFVQYVLSYMLPYKARLVFGFGAIVTFAILVGLSATVVRASVMASILLLLQFSGSTYNVLRGLFLAGVLMLLWNPYLLIYDPGFQLSFLATLGLILLAPHIEKWVRFVPTVLSVREFLVATLATQLFVLPFLLYQIGEFSMVAVLVNVLVLPMVPVAMLLTFFTGLAGFISPTVAVLFGALAQVSLTYILRIAQLFAEIPYASFTVPAFSFWLVLVGYVLLGYGVYRVHKPVKAKIYLPGWTIEVEEVVRKRVMAASQSDTAITETPVFFK